MKKEHQEALVKLSRVLDLYEQCLSKNLRVREIQYSIKNYVQQIDGLLGKPDFATQMVALASLSSVKNYEGSDVGIQLSSLKERALKIQKNAHDSCSHMWVIEDTGDGGGIFPSVFPFVDAHCVCCYSAITTYDYKETIPMLLSTLDSDELLVYQPLVQVPTIVKEGEHKVSDKVNHKLLWDLCRYVREYKLDRKNHKSSRMIADVMNSQNLLSQDVVINQHYFK